MDKHNNDNSRSGNDKLESSEVNEDGDRKPAARQSEDEKDESVDAGVLERKWEDMFSRLVKYKERFGNVLVPNRFAEDPQLGSWVSTQRRQYRILQEGSTETTPMTRERAQRLESIGFQWSTKDPRHVPWQQRYEELVEFQNKYGHSQVPIGWEENVQLSNWVSTQRQEYKLLQKGRSSRLTPQKIELLNKVDFIWEAQRGGPRRKRKATVMVPPKATPVVGVGPNAAKKGGHSGIRFDSHLSSTTPNATANQNSAQQQIQQINAVQGISPANTALLAQQLRGLPPAGLQPNAIDALILARLNSTLQPNLDLSSTSQQQLQTPWSLTAAAIGMAQALQQQQAQQQLLQGLRSLQQSQNAAASSTQHPLQQPLQHPLQQPLPQIAAYAANNPTPNVASTIPGLQPTQPDETGTNSQQTSSRDRRKGENNQDKTSGA